MKGFGNAVVVAVTFVAGSLLGFAAFEKLMTPTYAVETMQGVGLGRAISVAVLAVLIAFEFFVASIWVGGLGSAPIRVTCGILVFAITGVGAAVDGWLAGRCGCFGDQIVPIGLVRWICAAGGVASVLHVFATSGGARLRPPTARGVAVRVLLATAFVSGLRLASAPDRESGIAALQAALGAKLQHNATVAVVGAEDCAKCARLLRRVLDARAAGHGVGPNAYVLFVAPAPGASPRRPSTAWGDVQSAEVQLVRVDERVWWGLLGGRSPPVVLERCRGCEFRFSDGY